MKEMVVELLIAINEQEKDFWGYLKYCFGLSYSVISFCASLRGSEGLMMDYDRLRRYIERGRKNKVKHVIVPLR